MIVEEHFSKDGRILKQKITHCECPSIWEWEYFEDMVIERRSNSFWKKITNHIDKTTKLVYPDKTEYNLMYEEYRMESGVL